MKGINKNNSGSLRLNMKEINKIILSEQELFLLISFMFNLNETELFD
jgi:hypothetical protein